MFEVSYVSFKSLSRQLILLSLLVFTFSAIYFEVLAVKVITLQEAGLIADKMVKAERQIAACPHDTEAWSVLIRDCQVVTLKMMYFSTG
jgi:hypothetical protein